jgi:hypothetical protein
VSADTGVKIFPSKLIIFFFLKIFPTYTLPAMSKQNFQTLLLAHSCGIFPSAHTQAIWFAMAESLPLQTLAR